MIAMPVRLAQSAAPFAFGALWAWWGSYEAVVLLCLAMALGSLVAFVLNLALGKGSPLRCRVIKFTCLRRLKESFGRKRREVRVSEERRVRDDSNRSSHRRRRHQRRGHRPRCGRPWPFGGSLRAGRPCRLYLLGQHEADPWRPALSRILRVPPRSRGACSSASACSTRRRTSSGRCASSCPTRRASGPAWFVRLGLFLYDHLAPRKKLPGTETIHLTRHPAGQALKPGFDTAFVYSDCWVEDSRMVALNALDAAERGAEIRVRTKLVSARRDGDVWVGDASGRGDRRDRRRSARASSSMPAAPSWRTCSTPSSASTPTRTCASSRAATSSCRSSSRASRPSSCRTRTSGSSSRSPTRGSSRWSARPTSRSRPCPDKKVEISDDEIRYLCDAINHFFKREIDAGGRGLDLFGRAPALRRRLEQRLGGDPRLRVRSRRAARPGAGAVDLRRQDHHLPQARRARPRRAEAVLPGHEAGLDGDRQAARRRHAGCGFRPLLRRP